MRSITLDFDPQGRRILSCICGTIEIGRASDWQEFTVEAIDNGLTVVTCTHCQRRTRLGRLDTVEPQSLPHSLV